MKIRITSVMVSNQEKALQFYTDVLGFKKKKEIPLGEHKWLTVVSPEEPDGVEVLLEPMGFAPAKIYQQELYKAGIPLTAFHVDNVEKEFERLTNRKVVFSMKPTQMGPVKIAVFDDTCGNHIQLVQVL